MPQWHPIAALVIATLATWAGDRWILQWAKSQEVTSAIRKDGPKTHQKKAKTPSIGGAVFPLGYLLVLLGGYFLTARGLGDPEARQQLLLTFALLLFIPTSAFLLGLTDDYLKLRKKDSEGLKARYRLPVQLLLGALLGYAVYRGMGPDYAQWVPLPGVELALLPSMLLVLWTTLYFAGTVNAVNFTDGLDTLLAGVGVVALLIVGGLSYGWFGVRWIAINPLAGHAAMAGAGALLGFYPWNRHPAKLFMGDGGAYFIGALLATVTTLQGTPFMFLLVGGVFFIELLSVVLQVSVFRLSGGRKRLFPMAPLHHSFEVKGWPETKVVTLFWSAAIIFGIIGLAFARSL